MNRPIKYCNGIDNGKVNYLTKERKFADDISKNVKLLKKIERFAVDDINLTVDY